MICNIARAAAGGGGSTDNWELIETFSGNGNYTTGSYAYEVNRSQSADGTPYRFKSLVVEVRNDTTAEIKCGLQSAYIALDSGNAITTPKETYGAGLSAGYNAKMYAIRANGVFITDGASSKTGLSDILNGVITSFTIQFNKNNGATPGNFTFNVYAIRA